VDTPHCPGKKAHGARATQRRATVLGLRRISARFRPNARRFTSRPGQRRQLRRPWRLRSQPRSRPKGSTFRALIYCRVPQFPKSALERVCRRRFQQLAAPSGCSKFLPPNRIERDPMSLPKFGSFFSQAFRSHVRMAPMQPIKLIKQRVKIKIALSLSKPPGPSKLCRLSRRWGPRSRRWR
jgi:hypothetical protein